MRTLKQIRLVYRQHLLPPLVVPFEKITDYRKVLENDRVLWNVKKNRNEQMFIMHQINQTVITQILKIRNNFVLPLLNCPFYYQELDKFIRDQISRDEGSSKLYSEALKSCSPLQKMRIYKKINRTYQYFRERVEEQYQSFYKNVRYLPVFPFQSPQELANASKKEWNKLSEFQKIKIKENYETKLSAYWKTLNKIAEQSSIQVEHLIQLMKTQMNPPLSNGLKKLLFPTESRSGSSSVQQNHQLKRRI